MYRAKGRVSRPARGRPPPAQGMLPNLGAAAGGAPEIYILRRRSSMIDVNPPGMITSYREVVSVGAKITVSLPEPLLVTLDRLARQWATTRSGAVAELLRRAEREELEQELEEGYITWAEANRRDAEAFLPAQAEVVLRDQG